MTFPTLSTQQAIVDDQGRPTIAFLTLLNSLGANVRREEAAVAEVRTRIHVLEATPTNTTSSTSTTTGAAVNRPTLLSADEHEIYWGDNLETAGEWYLQRLRAGERVSIKKTHEDYSAYTSVEAAFNARANIDWS